MIFYIFRYSVLSYRLKYSTIVSAIVVKTPFGPFCPLGLKSYIRTNVETGNKTCGFKLRFGK